MNRKFIWPMFFLLLGIFSVVSQSVLLREITTSFHGNEIFYGFSLGVWFLFTGLGSLVVAKKNLLDKVIQLPRLLFLFILILFPIFILILRFLRGIFLPLGEIPDLGASILVMCLLLSLFCLILGALFTLGVLGWDRKKTNRAYFWETVGFGIGGLIFSFILATTYFPLGEKLNFWSYKFQFPEAIKAINSKHNHILVTKEGKVDNYFLGGRLSFTNQEQYESEKLVGTIIPYNNSINGVLVLGNPNLAKEISKHQKVNKTGYLEIDERLLELEKEILGEKVNVYLGDPRKSLKIMEDEWDMIIFSLGNPETLLSNRYFTVESFELVRKSLRSDGVFHLILYVPSSYQSREALYFTSSIYEALDNIFPFTKLLVLEDQIVFMASGEPIDVNQAYVVPKWENHFLFVNSDFRSPQLFEKIRNIQAQPNRDLEPTAFYYQQLFWQTIFSFALPRILFQYSVLLPIILVVAFLILFVKSSEKYRLGLLMSAASFLLIAVEVMIILLFQVKIGYLYNKLSLIFAAALLGMAVGVHLAKKLISDMKNISFLFLAFLLYLVTFFLGAETNIAAQSIYWFMAMFIAGVIGGAIFALLNNIYLKKEKNPGFIYGFDLLGGSLGAFLTSTIFLPVFGMQKVLCGLAVLIVANVVLIAKHH